MDRRAAAPAPPSSNWDSSSDSAPVSNGRVASPAPRPETSMPVIGPLGVGSRPDPLEEIAQSDLLNAIDTLRAQGVSRYIDLPQIIVCGDQSSGKSSVLEAISGFRFPAKDKLCTRFATELILRRSSRSEIDISIIPSKTRSELGPDLALMRTWKPSAPITAAHDLDMAAIMREAASVMGIVDGPSSIATDLLRITISGPRQPHLTLVDLPGLFEASNRAQTTRDADAVKDLVLSYMRMPRSIILAVVSAKSDFAVQQITQRARELDPAGLRTLGLITKPDTLDEGSESEEAYIALALNQDVEFRLGWHLLRNRDYRSRHYSPEERDRQEDAFFSRGAWRGLPRSICGIRPLRERLGAVLRDHITAHLPGLVRDVRLEIDACEAHLAELGPERNTLASRRQYLITIANRFSDLIKSAVQGEYSAAFFVPVGQPQAGNDQFGAPERLRAFIQNRLESFVREMETNGHKYTIVEGEDPCDRDRRRHPQAGVVARSRYLEMVKAVMRGHRGRELPGTFNPMVVGILFKEQSQPWGGIINDLVDQVFQAAKDTILAAVNDVCDRDTASSLYGDLLESRLAGHRGILKSKVEEILTSHSNNHPITYNEDFVRNVEQLQRDRRANQFRRLLRPFLAKTNVPAAERRAPAAAAAAPVPAPPKRAGFSLWGGSFYSAAAAAPPGAAGTQEDPKAKRRQPPIEAEGQPGHPGRHAGPLNRGGGGETDRGVADDDDDVFAQQELDRGGGGGGGSGGARGGDGARRANGPSRMCRIGEEELLEMLLDQPEQKPEAYAASLAVDNMMAYYKVAMKKVIDDISVLAIEDCLIGQLPDLFSPDDAYGLSDLQVDSIASESVGAKRGRAALVERLGVLQKGHVELQRLSFGQGTGIRMSSLGKRAAAGDDGLKGEQTGPKRARGRAAEQQH